MKYSNLVKASTLTAVSAAGSAGIYYASKESQNPPEKATNIQPQRQTDELDLNDINSRLPEEFKQSNGMNIPYWLIKRSLDYFEKIKDHLKTIDTKDIGDNESVDLKWLGEDLEELYKFEIEDLKKDKIKELTESINFHKENRDKKGRNEQEWKSNNQKIKAVYEEVLNNLEELKSKAESNISDL